MKHLKCKNENITSNKNDELSVKVIKLDVAKTLCSLGEDAHSDNNKKETDRKGIPNPKNRVQCTLLEI